MCLIVFAYKTHPDYELILAANRDEFYQRPTSTADWWNDHPNLLAGRDLKAQGTWMGVDKKGRFSAVTNYRDLTNIRENARSRGDLPVSFLNGNEDGRSYVENISNHADQYNGFNLLTFDGSMTHFSNYENKLNELSPGIYGLSNALLDTPWPKVEKAKMLFTEIVRRNFHSEDLIGLMQDPVVATEEELPKTGLSLDMERAVSAMCIRTPNYGTCCTTILTVDKKGEVEFIEKSYPVGDRKDQSVSFNFKAEK